MKKLLSIAMASLAVAALADPPANTASPTIGVTAITVTQKNTIVAVPFKSLADGGNIAVTDLVATNNLSVGDWLYVFDGTSYSAWSLTAEGWVATASASTTGGVTDAVANDAKKYVAAPGAIWLVLKDAPKPSKTVYIYGNFDNPPTSVSLSQGIASYLLANPLQKVAAVSVTPTKKDAVVIPTDDGQDKYTYTQLRGQPESIGWYKNGVKYDALPEIPVGQGFWYIRNTADPVTITWQ